MNSSATPDKSSKFYQIAASAELSAIEENKAGSSAAEQTNLFNPDSSTPLSHFRERDLATNGKISAAGIPDLGQYIKYQNSFDAIPEQQDAAAHQAVKDMNSEAAILNIVTSSDDA